MKINKLLFITHMMVLLFGITSCSSEYVGNDYLEKTETDITDYAVTMEEAVATAQNALNTFYENAGINIDKKSKNAACKVIKTRSSGDSFSTTDSNSFYIVNFEDGGFAVVSADKRATEIYAISDEGSFDEKANEGVETFMAAAEEYQKEEIANYSASLGTIKPDTLKKYDDANPYLIVVDNDGVSYNLKTETIYSNKPFYLLKTKWKQGEPYNNECPTIDGMKTPAGCAPIALAQIFAYHKQPQEYNGHRYYWDYILANSSYGILFDEETSSLATLIHDIGIVAGTEYGTSASLTKTKKIAKTCETFGYSHDDLSSFNYSNVITSINNGSPVFMRGTDTNSDDGHAWVVDGYYATYNIYTYYKLNTWEIAKTAKSPTKNYIHCNWGWGGTSNGFFLSDVLDPKTSDGNTHLYSKDIKIITNIQYTK